MAIFAPDERLPSSATLIVIVIGWGWKSYHNLIISIFLYKDSTMEIEMQLTFDIKINFSSSYYCCHPNIQVNDINHLKMEISPPNV